MIVILGGRCACCKTEENLTFDCIVPRGSAHHRGNAEARILFYRRQMLDGNVQLLCQSCNSLKADLSLALWLAAVSAVRAREQTLRPSLAPVQGAGLKPPQRVDMLREYLNAMRIQHYGQGPLQCEAEQPSSAT
jgi:hypothetical protein